MDHGSNHEGRVDDFAEAELLDEVVRATEQADRRRLALDELFHALEQHAVGIVQLDLFGFEIWFQRLHSRIMAAGLITDRNRHVG